MFGAVELLTAEQSLFSSGARVRYCKQMGFGPLGPLVKSSPRLQRVEKDGLRWSICVD